MTPVDVLTAPVAVSAVTLASYVDIGLLQLQGQVIVQKLELAMLATLYISLATKNLSEEA